MFNVVIASLLLTGHIATAPVHPKSGLPARAPALVGMSADRLARIDHLIEQGIMAGGYPGASVVVGRNGFSVLEEGFGHIGWSKNAPAVVADRTIYDLASLTKVVGTTSAIMVLFDQGKVSLDDRVSKFIPEFSGGAKDRVTVRMLLEHRSGLPAGRNLFRTAHSPAQARAQVIATHLQCAPGSCYEYSDLGADMLGFIVEAASGQRLDHFLAQYVFDPLGMHDTFFLPADSVKDRIAPTKLSSKSGEPLPGEVHDGSADVMGGIAGHAGLFSTASDLSVFAQMMLNGGEYDGVRVIADSTVRLFTLRAAGSRALGWDTCKGEGGCGEYLDEHAFGHTGYTGTSLWIDPDRDMFVVLLTNRVYLPRVRRPAKVIADVRADLADASVLSVEDFGTSPMVMPELFRSDLELGWNHALRVTHAKSTKTPAKKPVAAVAVAAAPAKKPASLK